MSLIRADAINIPLQDGTVDLVVTSPPYFSLRSYTDGGEHYDGQIGSEPTPQDFLEALWAVTAECARVLKPSGSIWVNLGDKMNEKCLMGLPWRYAIGCIDQLGLILRAEVIWSKPNGLPESVTDRVRRSHEQWFMFTKQGRYYSAVDEIRESRSGDVVELPPEHLPSCPLFVGPPNTMFAGSVCGPHEPVAGVKDGDLTHQVWADHRVDGEDIAGPQQEHDVRPLGATVPLLVGVDTAVIEDGAHLGDDGLVPVVDVDAEVGATGAAVREGHGALSVDDASEPSQVCTCGHATYHTTSLGKLPGSVWVIPSEPLKVPDHLGVDHFAAYPQEWPRRIILGWSPPGICTRCGDGRRPVVERTTSGHDNNATSAIRVNGAMGGTKFNAMKAANPDTITGYACGCPEPDAPTRPAVVLDPFGGTGTTAMVARALGRYPVHMDLSADYLRLAQWRIYESGHAAKTVTRTNGERRGAGRGDLVNMPAVTGDDQLDLFGGAA